MSDLLLLAGTCLARTDAGDLHLRVLLPVTLTAPVARLVLVVDHVDLRAAGGPEDLGGDLVAAELGAIGDHLLAIHDEHGRQRHGGADIAGELVHGQDVVNGRPVLIAAAANDRVHERTLSPWCQPAAESRPRPNVEATGPADITRRSPMGSQTRRRQRIPDHAPFSRR